MGLLSEGSPLSWEETKKWAGHVQQHGIQQFINLYHKLKDRQYECLKWGDEIEYVIVKFDHEKKTARVSLRAAELLPKLQQREKENPEGVASLWRPEYGAYMIEGTPGKPYGGLTSHFNIVEANMRLRREEVQEFLEPDESLMCLTSYPRLGCGDFTYPIYKPTPHSGVTRSLYFPDEAIYSVHPRFRTLSRNIRERRGKKVIINIPIYKDTNTPDPFIEDFTSLGDEGEAAAGSLPNHVYMDAMGFGMGCSCLQVTFQACNIKEARILYDQLTPICPIAMALSAASPIHRGYLTDRDCRWSVVAASVDDRTDEELGLKPLEENKYRIHKSRYDSIDSYISEAGEEFNDIDLVYDQNLCDQLEKAGIDHLLAKHIAHLFIRDPIALFAEKLHLNDQEDSDHFENIQSTNWQTMRFKPPPPNTNIGLRVEFRPLEVQMTEFENAAFVVFVVLLTRVILSFQLNFLIPISKVDENLQEAQKRAAVRTSKFWFRKDIITLNTPPETKASFVNHETNQHETCQSECIQMTINEIINGKGCEFPGLVPLIRKFLASVDIDVDTQCTIQQYLTFIQQRASGELLTTAEWIRNFVHNHPSYKHDSVISEVINYDLLVEADRIQKGEISCPELLGHPSTKSRDRVPSAVRKIEDCFTMNSKVDCS